jgi:hypothetical protein
MIMQEKLSIYNAPLYCTLPTVLKGGFDVRINAVQTTEIGR